MFSPLLAHAGGFSWDEALLVMTPIAIVAGVLFLANQRAKRFGPDGPEPDGPPDTGSAPDPARDAAAVHGAATGDGATDAAPRPTTDPAPRPATDPAAGPTPRPTSPTTGPPAE